MVKYGYAAPVRSLNAEDISEIRAVVSDAMRLWPNAHLGDYTRRQDMRSAFHLLRVNAGYYNSIATAIAVVAENVRAHEAM